MGLGDQILATGLARGAADRGRRIAFGNGVRIIWDGNSETIFRGNKNLAPPGSEGAADLDWVPFYKGLRQYNTHDKAGRRWVWNYSFKAKPGEVFLSDEEKNQGARMGSGFVFIEPNVMPEKLSAGNKQWPIDRFQAVADVLMAKSYRVVQPLYVGARFSLQRCERVQTKSFRDALALLSNAALAIIPEGGMSHGAAAVGVHAVVIYGGFAPPAVLGYDGQYAATGGAEACGSLKPCPHCAAAMAAITADEVIAAAMEKLRP